MDAESNDEYWSRVLESMIAEGQKFGEGGLEEPLFILAIAYIGRKQGFNFNSQTTNLVHEISHILRTLEPTYGLNTSSIVRLLLEKLSGYRTELIEDWVDNASIAMSGNGFTNWFRRQIPNLNLGYHEPPQAIIDFMLAQLASVEAQSVFDPMCGTGGMIVTAAKEFGDRQIAVYGQEQNELALAWATLNAIVADVKNVQIEQRNSLEQPISASEKQISFDFVLSNPPFGMRLETSELRWLQVLCVGAGEKLPPRISSEAAAVLNVFHRLSQKGQAAIIVPTGFLTKSGFERRIREALLEKKSVKAVIGLPAGLFAPNTMIEIAILLLNRNEFQNSGEEIYFVDARSFGVREGRKTVVETSTIKQINNALESRKSALGFSQSVSIDQVRSAEFSLLPAHYISQSKLAALTGEDRLRKMQELGREYEIFRREYEQLHSELSGQMSKSRRLQ